jgi:gamma-glutamylcyclotransferase (GGCT)/AIG2-like uncharacterized protein YtfP
MLDRCRDAIPIKSCGLSDWKLVFRGVADIIPAPQSYVYGALWSLSDRDLNCLDHFEGIGRGLYKRIDVREGASECVFAYVMHSKDIWPPDEEYFQTIQQGYSDWNLPIIALMAARRDAYDYNASMASRSTES